MTVLAANIRRGNTAHRVLYRWDLECLIDVIDVAPEDGEDYPNKSAPEFQASNRLGERLHETGDTYGDE